MEPRISQKVYGQFRRFLRYSKDEKILKTAFDLWFQCCKEEPEVFWSVLFEISLQYKNCKYLKLSIEKGALNFLFHDDAVAKWKYELEARRVLEESRAKMK